MTSFVYRLTSSNFFLHEIIPFSSTLFQKLRGGAGSKRYGMDFPVYMKEKKKIREITTVSAPVNGKIHSILL
jgi:hypothetical protein